MTTTNSGLARRGAPVRTRMPPSVIGAGALIGLAVLLGLLDQVTAGGSWLATHHPATASTLASSALNKARPATPAAGAHTVAHTTVLHTVIRSARPR